MKTKLNVASFFLLLSGRVVSAHVRKLKKSRHYVLCAVIRWEEESLVRQRHNTHDGVKAHEYLKKAFKCNIGWRNEHSFFFLMLFSFITHDDNSMLFLCCCENLLVFLFYDMMLFFCQPATTRNCSGKEERRLCERNEKLSSACRWKWCAVYNMQCYEICWISREIEWGENGKCFSNVLKFMAWQCCVGC